ncbi:hypothetical protein Acsp03_36770 [Actinomadura sp. NBRC 104412]|nr:hypothetical protein Acsp03_36770 [Actinomadura sp. NBRC 104412]
MPATTKPKPCAIASAAAVAPPTAVPHGRPAARAALSPAITRSACRGSPAGSGISLGHPVGATGARILATLLREMDRREARYGLETMCIGGGQGLAAVFERIG